MDDLLLFADDKPSLHGWRRAIDTRLATLRLTAHRGAHPRPVSEGIPFLGFVVFPDRRRLKRRKGVHFLRRLRGLLAAYDAGLLPPETVAAAIEGWLNHIRYGNTVGLRRAVLAAVPPAIMALVHCAELGRATS